jgi:hypothetical protein
MYCVSRDFGKDYEKGARIYSIELRVIQGARVASLSERACSFSALTFPRLLGNPALVAAAGFVYSKEISLRDYMKIWWGLSLNFEAHDATFRPVGSSNLALPEGRHVSCRTPSLAKGNGDW